MIRTQPPATSFFRRLAIAIWIATSCLARAQTPAKDLVAYIQDARRSGVKEEKIKQDATAVGWSASAVDEALRFVKENKAAESPTTKVAPQGTSRVNPLSSRPPEPAVVSQAPPTAASSVPDDYQIDAGDIIQVSVWKEPDISVPNIAVRPDGMITVPLIKEVAMAGLTPRQAERLITEKLSKFVTDPNVTVVVTASNSKKVHVIGAVRREGPLPYTYRMTVIQALSEAGGLTEYAKRKKIYVLRSDSGRDYRLDFNYDEVIRGERMEQNVVLLPGDTVVIPH